MRLVKLHGSVTWQRSGGGIIGLAVPRSRGKDEDILVEPILDIKDYNREPFKRLFHQCDEMLSATDMLLVAIRYSFRDDAINKKIMDSINRGTQMFVMSPSVERDIRENLKPPAKRIWGIRSRIKTMYEEFGRDGIAGLCEYMKDILDSG